MRKDSNFFNSTRPLTSPLPITPKPFVSQGLGDNVQYFIKIDCPISKELRDKWFSNKISAKDLHNKIRSVISKILKMDGKIIISNQLHFNIEEKLTENKTSKGRVENILNLYGHHLNEKIIKVRWVESYDNTKHSGDTLRLFIVKDSENINIVLIDPHHLVATENYRQIYKENSDKFKYCYSCLKDISIFD